MHAQKKERQILENQLGVALFFFHGAATAPTRYATRTAQPSPTGPQGIAWILLNDSAGFPNVQFDWNYVLTLSELLLYWDSPAD
jgi:hypothetical protein